MFLPSTAQGFREKATIAQMAAADALKVDLAPVATLANSTSTAETALASWTIAANQFIANRFIMAQWYGQVSSTSTLIYRIRCGPSATALASRALVAVFTTSAAGVANQHTTGYITVSCATTGASGTVSGGGMFWLNTAPLPQVAGAFAAATVDTTVANVLSITVVQSAANTVTSRAANLNILT